MDNGGTRFIILLLGDPHLLERAQRRQDGATNPHGVLPLRGCHHLDLHRGWREGCQLLSHAFTYALEHRGTTRKHNISIEVLTNIHVAFHDRLERCAWIPLASFPMKLGWNRT